MKITYNLIVLTIGALGFINQFRMDKRIVWLALALDFICTGVMTSATNLDLAVSMLIIIILCTVFVIVYLIVFGIRKLIAKLNNL